MLCVRFDYGVGARREWLSAWSSCSNSTFSSQASKSQESNDSQSDALESDCGCGVGGDTCFCSFCDRIVLRTRLTSPELSSEMSLISPRYDTSGMVGFGIGGRDATKERGPGGCVYVAAEGCARVVGGSGIVTKVGGWNSLLCRDIQM